MKKYYINGAANESDALSFEDLQKRGLHLSDYVWFEGLLDWTSVNEIEELTSLLIVDKEAISSKDKSSTTPPPFNAHSKDEPLSQKKKTQLSTFMVINLGKSHLVKVVYSLIALICFWSIIVYKNSYFHFTSIDKGLNFSAFAISLALLLGHILSCIWIRYSYKSIISFENYFKIKNGVSFFHFDIFESEKWNNWAYIFPPATVFMMMNIRELNAKVIKITDFSELEQSPLGEKFSKLQRNYASDVEDIKNDANVYGAFFIICLMGMFIFFLEDQYFLLWLLFVIIFCIAMRFFVEKVETQEFVILRSEID